MTNKQIVALLSVAFFIYLSIAFTWGHFQFWLPDTWRTMGGSLELAETGQVNTFSFQYPTMGYQTLLALLTRLLGLQSMQSFIFFSLIMALVPVYVVYVISNKKPYTLLASFLTIFGFERYAINITSTVSIVLGYVLISLLLHLNHLFIQKKHTFLLALVTLVLFLSLLEVHLWGAFLYLSFYFFFMLFIMLKYPKRFGTSLVLFFIFTSSFVLFFPVRGILLHVPVYYHFLLSSPLLFLVCFLAVALFYRLRCTALNLLGFLETSIIENYVTYVRTGVVLIPSLILMGLYSVYLITPYETNRTFLEVLMAHLDLPVFLTLAWVGSILMIRDEKRFSFIFIWIFTCLSLFIASFILPILGFNVIVSWRQLVYLSLVGMIPIARALFWFKDKRWLFYALVLGVVALSVSTTLVENTYHYTDEELASLFWLKHGVPQNAVIATDGRLAGPIWVISEKNVQYLREYDYSVLFLSSPDSNEFKQKILYTVNVYKDKQGVTQKYTGADYVLWSDEFKKQGIFTGETKKRLKLKYNPFERNPLFIKIYSSKNVSLYKINRSRL